MTNDDEEGMALYMKEFMGMSSTQVMAYRWPTEQTSSHSNNFEDDWIPMDYPAIPQEKAPKMNSVAGSRKFNVLPFEGDGFTSAVNAQRAGAGAPGLCGLGLTRDKSKFSTQESNSNSTIPYLSSVKSAGSARMAPSFMETADPESDDKGIAGLMFKAAGVQLLSGTMKEEERWRDVYRACLDKEVDPFEDAENKSNVSLPGNVLSDRIASFNEDPESNESLAMNIQKSPALRAIRDHPALQDALSVINDGDLAPNEWIHFCDAVRDIVKWNEFTM